MPDHKNSNLDALDSDNDSGVEAPSGSRREALKKAGIAGSAVAGGVWIKPAINAAVLPAHATRSVFTLSGPTGTSYMGAVPEDTDKRIVNKITDALIPAASAAGVVPGKGPARFATNPGTLGLCVNLEFPEGNNPNGPIDITVTGPGVTSYYAGAVSTYNLSSSGSGTLVDLDFDVNLGGRLRVTGCLTDGDFSGAEGYVELLQNFGPNGSIYYESSYYGGPFTAGPVSNCSTGYGYNCCPSYS